MVINDFRLLAYFVEIVRAGSIRGAARHLSLSPAVISTALRDLEAVIGATLLKRTTRTMTLTETGSVMFERAVAAMDAFENAMAVGEKSGGQVEGKLGVTLPVELALTWIPGLLEEFQSRHPGIDMIIHADDREIALAKSDFEIAIRAKYSAEPVAGAITNIPLTLVCAPVPDHSPGTRLQTRLDERGFVGMPIQTESGTLPAKDRKTGKVRHLKIRWQATLNNQYVSREFAKQGIGAALLMSTSVSDDIARGELVAMGADLDFGYVSVRMVHRDRRPSPAALAFETFLLAL